MHQLLKHDIVPESKFKVSCGFSTAVIDDSDLTLEELILHDTQLLHSDDSSKHQIVYTSGFLVQKRGQQEVDSVESLSSEFVTELDRDGLSMPTSSIIYFVRSAVTLQISLQD